MSEENKIAAEVAEKEFLQWCEVMDLDTDESSMEEQEKKDWNELKKRFIVGIQKGRMRIEGEEITLVLRHSPKCSAKMLTFKPMTGAMLMEGDKAQGSGYKKNFAKMAANTGVNPVCFAHMDQRDLKYAASIFLLLTSG